jgi:peptide methionine sulfoxide reductase msrA/msrB
MKRYRSLTPEEAVIIENTGTENLGSRKHEHLEIPGVFLCIRCDAPLYLASDRFESGCGEPSFDDAITDAVRSLPSLDGHRTEIRCQRCDAHLGHLVVGEGFTPKNPRHCVNSWSLSFAPAFTEQGYERAIFAGGCFWGVQYYLNTLPGVISTTVGYTGGDVIDPTYKEVRTGETGHVEAIEVVLDLQKDSYEKVAREFFEIHDPAQPDGQGPDIGPQYKSKVFYLTTRQKMILHRLIDELRTKGFKVLTVLEPASGFYMAEEYHQNYYDKNGSEPYCHKKTKRF